MLGHRASADGGNVKRRIRVVPQENNLDEQVTVLDNLLIYGRYSDIGGRPCPGVDAGRGGVRAVAPGGEHDAGADLDGDPAAAARAALWICVVTAGFLILPLNLLRRRLVK